MFWVLYGVELGIGEFFYNYKENWYGKGLVIWYR